MTGGCCLHIVNYNYAAFLRVQCTSIGISPESMDFHVPSFTRGDNRGGNGVLHVVVHIRYENQSMVSLVLVFEKNGLVDTNRHVRGLNRLVADHYFSNVREELFLLELQPGDYAQVLNRLTVCG